VFDLKAVNPNAVTTVDGRTQAEIIASIDAQGRIVNQALVRLRALLSAVLRPPKSRVDEYPDVPDLSRSLVRTAPSPVRDAAQAR
jgi:hypothetical protein